MQLDHARISRRHARLRLDGPVALEDLGSRNGTLVHGRAIPPGTRVVLRPGESFMVGPFTVVPVAEDASPPRVSSMVIEEPAPRVPPAMLLTIARSPLTVLIRGESGVGKEVLAETLHRLSGRPGQLLRLNCAGFNPELLESELFGHERGAFTGAVAPKAGLLEAASGGTLFLDEVGELPPPLQARLLRALEAREVLRVGGTRPVPIDARFVAATNRDLYAAIAGGEFRLDLYYRLAVLTLMLPPLRERPERILGLAEEIAAAAAARSGLRPPHVSPSAAARLQRHSYPGNVRELRNVIERAALFAGDGDIDASHIVFDSPADAAAAPPASTPSPTERDDDERQRIIDALASCAGNQTRAAKLLGVSRATLAVKLAVHRIPRPRR